MNDKLILPPGVSHTESNVITTPGQEAQQPEISAEMYNMIGAFHTEFCSQLLRYLNGKILPASFTLPTLEQMVQQIPVRIGNPDLSEWGELNFIRVDIDKNLSSAGEHSRKYAQFIQNRRARILDESYRRAMTQRPLGGMDFLLAFAQNVDEAFTLDEERTSILYQELTAHNINPFLRDVERLELSEEALNEKADSIKAQFESLNELPRKIQEYFAQHNHDDIEFPAIVFSEDQPSGGFSPLAMYDPLGHSVIMSLPLLALNELVLGKAKQIELMNPARQQEFIQIVQALGLPLLSSGSTFLHELTHAFSGSQLSEDEILTDTGLKCLHSGLRLMPMPAEAIDSGSILFTEADINIIPMLPPRWRMLILLNEAYTEVEAGRMHSATAEIFPADWVYEPNVMYMGAIAFLDRLQAKLGWENMRRWYFEGDAKALLNALEEMNLPEQWWTAWESVDLDYLLSAAPFAAEAGTSGETGVEVQDATVKS